MSVQLGYSIKPVCLVEVSLPQPKFPVFPFFPFCKTPSLLVSSPSLRHCFEWSILPACITFCRRRRGSGGGLWRRVLRRPIGARLGRRTAHVYRQHSAGRGSTRLGQSTEWISQEPDLESPNGRIFKRFQHL